MGARITGIGYHVPERVVTNASTPIACRDGIGRCGGSAPAFIEWSGPGVARPSGDARDGGAERIEPLVDPLVAPFDLAMPPEALSSRHVGSTGCAQHNPWTHQGWSGPRHSSAS